MEKEKEQRKEERERKKKEREEKKWQQSAIGGHGRCKCSVGRGNPTRNVLQDLSR